MARTTPEVFQPTLQTKPMKLPAHPAPCMGLRFRPALAPALSCIRPLPIAALVLPYVLHIFLHPAGGLRLRRDRQLDPGTTRPALLEEPVQYPLQPGIFILLKNGLGSHIRRALV